MNRRTHRILFLIFGITFYSQVPLYAQYFTEKSQELGINYSYGPDAPSGGVSAVDFTGDGLDDLSFTSDSGHELSFFENTGNGFAPVQINLPGSGGQSKHLLWVDYDNDGDKDLFISYLDSENRLYRNEGSLTFTDVTQSSGLYLPVTTSYGTYGVAWSDYDRDGYLDLYITFKRKDLALTDISNHLFRNNGDGSFTEVTNQSGVAAPAKAPYCTAFVDYDADGWPDVYISNDRRQGNALYRNLGNGSFADVSESTKANLVIDAMSVTPGDYDNNDYEDIYITNIDGNKLLRNNGIEVFTEVGNNTGVGFFSTAWSAQFFDVDNDGDLDIYVSGSDNFIQDKFSSVLYLNNGSGAFTTQELPGDDATSYSNSIGDFNQDGYLDMVVPNPDPYTTKIWYNSGGSNHWLKVKIEGTLSNRDGIGAKVELFTGGNKYNRTKYCGEGFLSQNGDYLHFGLGSQNTIDSLHVIWPSGHEDKLYSLSADQMVMVTEGSTSTYAPYLNYSGVVKIFSGDSIVLNSGLYSHRLNYQWSTGSTSSALVVKASGKYALSIVNPELGLDFRSDTVEVVVDVLGDPTINYTKSDISCYGEQDGTISLDVTGPETYQVSWTNGSTGTSLNNLGQGVYVYDVIGDLSGCHKKGEVIIWEPDSLGVILDISSKTVRATVSGGVLPYTYVWSGLSSQSASATYSTNGSYTLQVTDGGGCSKIIPFTLGPSTVTGIIAEESIELYPNPTRGQITVSWGEKSRINHISLMDLSGRICKDYNPHGQQIIIDLQGTEQGMYYIILEDSGGRIVSRRVIVY